MESCLDDIENLWLSQGKFIAGDEITVADLFAACEIEQPRMSIIALTFIFVSNVDIFLGMAGYNPTKGRTILKNWLDRVKEATDPYYKEAHVVVNKIAAKQNIASKL